MTDPIQTAFDFVTRNRPIRDTADALEKSRNSINEATTEIRKLRLRLTHTPTVLLVDDEKKTGEMARRDCSDGKVRLLFALDTDGARDHLASGEIIDLAILDWRLKNGESGGDIIDECVATCRETCVLTGVMPPDDQARIREQYHGQVKIISKPIALHELLNMYL